jgi:hypothetical protein
MTFTFFPILRRIPLRLYASAWRLIAAIVGRVEVAKVLAGSSSFLALARRELEVGLNITLLALNVNQTSSVM